MCAKRRKSSTLRALDAGSDGPVQSLISSQQATPLYYKTMPIMTRHAHTPQGAAHLSHLYCLQGTRQVQLFSSSLSGKATAVKTQRLIIHRCCCCTRPQSIQAKYTSTELNRGHQQTAHFLFLSFQTIS